VSLSDSAELTGLSGLADLSAPAHLSVQMKHRLGALRLDLAFELTRPWTVLFGPSGSGKSTVLRAIAGLVRPDEARIVARVRGAENVLTDTLRGVFVAAHLRPVRWSAQGSMLLPHLTVRENVEYGVAGAGAGREIVDEVMERLRLNELGKKMAWEVSGGERNRVTLGRTIASTMMGEYLLLDEPFVGLDLRLRDELLVETRSWLEETKTPVLSVTHDVGEAFQLGAEVIRISDGKVVRQGSAEVVLAEERERLLGQLSLGDKLRPF
jgi:molybdate transport system ATP-binding protein